ncbi:MAG TPA: MFS transporter, partial [Novosphingobium sp.]|nr:MFS transporter [Novosphingobium sp.]
MIDTPRTHDVAALLNAQRFGRFHVMLIGLSLLVTFFDGFDMMMLSFAAPHIRETFGFGPIDLGHIFSSGLAGMVLGGFTLPWLGDRIGRRPTIILGVVGFGLFTLGTVMVASKAGFMTMRFLNGLALGGVLPLVWTLNIELVPQRLRASVVTIIMVGYSCGCALAGPLTVALVGRWGWQGVFGAGGIASLVCAVALAIWLPESLRFLILHQRPGARIAAALRPIAPDAHAGPQDRFQLADEAHAQEGAAPFRLADLFAGPLARITPFLWLGYVASTFGVYFGTSWGPILIEGMHFSRTSAAYLASMNSVAG